MTSSSATRPTTTTTRGSCRNSGGSSLRTAAPPLVVPVLVLAEAAHLIGSRLGPQTELRLLGTLARGELLAERVRPRDWSRIAQLVTQYADLPLGSADASVVAAAERLGIHRILTLDRRHFTVVRPAHIDAFELVP